MDRHIAIQQPLMHTTERTRSEEHTSELQSRQYLVCRLLLEKKKKTIYIHHTITTPTHHKTTSHSTSAHRPPQALHIRHTPYQLLAPSHSCSHSLSRVRSASQ